MTETISEKVLYVENYKSYQIDNSRRNGGSSS